MRKDLALWREMEVKYDTIIIDDQAINKNDLLDVAEIALNAVEGFHDKNYEQGRTPSGENQKMLDPSYAEKKRKGRVRVGNQYRGGTTPGGRSNLLLSGNLLRGRFIRRSRDEVEFGFFDEEAKKAAGLEERGFQLHYLSKKNISFIEKLFSNRIGESLAKMITIKKNT